MTALYYTDDTVTLWHGDCLDVLRDMPDASVDSVVTDPPYGLGFMGKEWDSDFQAADMPMRRNGAQDAVNAGASRQGGRQRAGVGYQRRMARDSRAFQDWCAAWAVECLRVLKPGGHILAFGGTRTSHRLACAVEDAGFEIRDSIAWLYGSGFPKSLDVSKAIDKAAGAARVVTGDDEDFARRNPNGKWGLGASHDDNQQVRTGVKALTAPATDDARTWQGWGTALKPAFEPVVVARKPLTGTVAANVLEWGTGALNVDACRIGLGESEDRAKLAARSGGTGEKFGRGIYQDGMENDGDGWKIAASGRWPANVVLDESQAAALNQQSGETVSNIRTPTGRDTRGVPNTESQAVTRFHDTIERGMGDRGGASRFFLVAPTNEPDERCPRCGLPLTAHPTECPWNLPLDPGGSPPADLPIDGLRERFFYTAKADTRERIRVDDTGHPTVKPLTLMRWLVRLVTPPGGTCLDPFAGSGTTAEACILEGFRCITIEKEADYLPLIVQRVNRQRDPIAYTRTAGEDLGLFAFGEGEGA